MKTQNLCMVIHARDPTESDTRKMNVTHSQLQQNYIKNKISKTLDIVMAMFDLGSQMTMTAGGAIYHEAGIPDVSMSVSPLRHRYPRKRQSELRKQQKKPHLQKNIR